MSHSETIFLLVLCGAMLGGIVLVYSGLRRVRATGPKLGSGPRLRVYLSVAATACALLSTGATLMAALNFGPSTDGHWRTFLFSLTLTVGCTYLTGAIAWSQVALAEASGRKQDK